MNKRILFFILSLSFCISSVVGTSSILVNAKSGEPSSADKVLQNNLWMRKSITVGKGEKCYIYYDTNRGHYEKLQATSSNSKVVKILKYTSGYANSLADSGNALFEGKDVGTAYINVRNNNFSASGTCKVIVKPAPSSVKLNTANLTLGVGEEFLIAENTNNGSYANEQNLKWTTSNSKVVTVRKIGGGNKADVIATGAGTATITVKTYNGKTATCKVTVKKAPSIVKLSTTNLILNKGKSYTISETTNSGSYANASNLRWSSSNTKVATVIKGSGNKATIKAVGKGTAYISIRTYNGKTATCKVTVK